jgi:hypothetical protein
LTITASVISGRQEGLFSWFGLLEKIVNDKQTNAIFKTSVDTKAADLKAISD